MKKKLIIILSVLLYSISAFCDDNITPQMPSSPQAEILTKRGEFTINNPTGTPDISIPLLEIDAHGFKIPLTMKYMPRPLKPGYNYDLYGFGWSLNSTYCISRNIESLADEEADFTLSYKKILDQDLHRLYPYFNEYNFVHDKFHVTLPTGTSFDFVIDNNKGKLEYTVSYPKKISIFCSYSKSNIYSFTVVDESGISYQFNEAEVAFTDNDNAWNRNVAWYLTKIQFPDKKDPIIFEYDQQIKTKLVQGINDGSLLIGEQYIMTDYNQPYNPNLGQKYFCSFYNGNNLIKYKMSLIKSIDYGSGRINFVYQYSQKETSYNYLKKIESPNKIIDFDYNYGYSLGFYPNGDPLADLTKITISSNNKTEPQVYSFKNSGVGGFNNGVDHWGNLTNNINQDGMANFNLYIGFNAANANGVFNTNKCRVIPNYPNETIPYSKIRLYYTEANGEFRSASSYPDSHNILREIIYPNGGKSDFIWENHVFLTHTKLNGDFELNDSLRRPIEGGGFRIKNISNYDVNGNLVDEYNYRYGILKNNFNTGYGEPVVDPNILTYSKFTYSPSVKSDLRNMMLCVSPYCHIFNEGPYGIDPTINEQIKYFGKFSNPFDNSGISNHYWDISISPDNFRNLLGGRDAVVYPEITIYHGNGTNPTNCSEKIVYKYNIYRDAPSGKVFRNLPFYRDNILVSGKDNTINQLNEKLCYSVKNEDYSLVSSEVYSYQNNYYTVDDAYNGKTFAIDWFPANSVVGATIIETTDQLGSYLIGGCTKKLYTDGDVEDNGSYSLTYNKYNEIKAKDYVEIYPVHEVYTYNSDIDTSAIAKEMCDNHIYNSLISDQKYVKYNDSTSLVSSKEFVYNKYVVNGKSYYLPSSMYESILSGAHRGANIQTKILEYTEDGNPAEIENNNGIHTIYLWAYGDRYPIAEIKNATKSVVEPIIQNIFGCSTNQLRNSSNITVDKLRQIQNLIPDAQITCYTFLPDIGVTSITAPNGKTMYYEYDGLGRLTEEYYFLNNSNVKYVLNRNSYHFSNQKAISNE